MQNNKIYKQEGPEGPRSLTWEIGQRCSHLQRTTNVHTKYQGSSRFNNFGRGTGIIPAEFGKISIRGSREEVVWRSFPYISQCKIVTPRRGKYWPQGHTLNNFGRGLLDNDIYQIWKLWALLFQTRFLKVAFLKPIFFNPVTYLCNQSEPFEQFW